jgi:hypothetical protein
VLAFDVRERDRIADVDCIHFIQNARSANVGI